MPRSDGCYSAWMLYLSLYPIRLHVQCVTCVYNCAPAVVRACSGPHLLCDYLPTGSKIHYWQWVHIALILHANGNYTSMCCHLPIYSPHHYAKTAPWPNSSLPTKRCLWHLDQMASMEYALIQHPSAKWSKLLEMDRDPVWTTITSTAVFRGPRTNVSVINAKCTNTTHHCTYAAAL